jgi:transposase-like protein
LTPQEADGRWNRRRFSDEQKRAMAQETEKPGVSVAEVCRLHGFATSLLFRWRVQFGLTARKAPQLATVTLTDGATNEVPARAALRDLVQPPDGMIAIDRTGGWAACLRAGTREGGWSKARSASADAPRLRGAHSLPAFVFDDGHLPLGTGSQFGENVPPRSAQIAVAPWRVASKIISISSVGLP